MTFLECTVMPEDPLVPTLRALADEMFDAEAFPAIINTHLATIITQPQETP